ncbi:MAG: DUF5926 family protein [Micrococcales bacterium]|nr:DUF5926 family protein [Micrococcales bacterium]
MGKASRRKAKAGAERPARVKVAPAPYARRPFEGLPGETDWVAMREILPAATATVRVKESALPEGVESGEATVATVLPMAWPALHRGDETVFVAAQFGASSGDASRDIAAALLAALATEAGLPVTATPQPTADTPRLQDILEAGDLEVTVHDGFEFWTGEAELEGEARESMERANASVIPTSKMSALPSAYWCQIGDRTYIRLILGDDEEAATDALARLHVAAEDSLGDGTRLLGAFRACGLLAPVFELDPTKGAGDYEDALAAFGTRYAAALASETDLTSEERRARSGLLSRQVTLR